MFVYYYIYNNLLFLITLCSYNLKNENSRLLRPIVVRLSHRLKSSRDCFRFDNMLSVPEVMNTVFSYICCNLKYLI